MKLRDNEEFLLQERPSFAVAVPVASLHACHHTFGLPRTGSLRFGARSAQASCPSARISMRAQKAPFHMKQTWRISHLCSVASQSNHTKFHAGKLFWIINHSSVFPNIFAIHKIPAVVPCQLIHSRGCSVLLTSARALPLISFRSRVAFSYSKRNATQYS